MSLLASLALTALWLALPASAEQAQAVFRNPVFEITMPPGVPLPTATKVGDAAGADYSSETPTVIYRMQYADMPAADAEKVFAAILGNIKQGFRLESSSRFTHQGYPGLRLIMGQTNPTQFTRMDCLMVNNRLVRVWFIAGTLPELDTSAVRAFFDSLRITGAKG